MALALLVLIIGSIVLIRVFLNGSRDEGQCPHCGETPLPGSANCVHCGGEMPGDRD